MQLNPDTSGKWSNVWNSDEDSNSLYVCLEEEGCQIDTKNDEVKLYSENASLIVDTDGFYQYQPRTDGEDGLSKFKRKINIEPQDYSEGNFNEALVTVNVRWGESSNFVEVKTLIYNY